MTKPELISGFSYESMDKDVAGKLRNLANRLQGLKEKLAGHILEIGETITIAHDQFAKQKTGEFLKWVEFEAGYSKSSAYNYMSAYRVFGNVPNFGRIEDSALYALAQNNTPENARKEALRLADKGVKITHKQAKAIIKKHKPKVSPGTTEGVGGSKPQPAPKPEPPQLSKEEQIKLEIKKTRSYVAVLVRSIDDCNRIKRNTVIHPKLHKLCGEILEGLDRW